MTALILTTYVFAWPTQHFTVKVVAPTWDAAYTQAVEFCVTHVKPGNDYETTIDICANPIETKHSSRAQGVL